jgi:hypothetical protein
MPGIWARVARGALPLTLVLLASTVSAQVILRPPGQPPPTPQRSQGQVARPPGTTDPDGPYTLALRVYVTPADTKRVLAPGQGVHLLLTDAAGQRFGREPSGRAFFEEIPNATYEAVVNPNLSAPVGPRGRAGVGIALHLPPEGKYELQVGGTEPLQFEYVLQAFDRTGRQRWIHFGTHGTERGAVDRFEVTYSLALDPPVWIEEKPDRSYLLVRAWGKTGRSQDVVTHLLLTDPRGRRLGHSSPAKADYKEIPRSSYGEAGQTVETMELEIMAPLSGAHTLEVIGTRTGRYDFEIHYTDGEGPDGVAIVEGIPTAPGLVHRYRLVCARGTKDALTLSGGFGSAELLSFASPTDASTRVRRARASFPVVVFYGQTILPESFRATLNGADVRARFHPKASGHDVVTLQLRPGKNELLLSVQGQGAAGEIATASSRLEFEVR